MPGRYQIEGVFTLGSEHEPDGHLYGIEDADGVSDYEDSSSWDSASFTVEGGIVGFVVEAVSEDDARDVAMNALSQATFSERDGFAWEIEDYSISSIEVIEEPWNMERAVSVIRDFLTRMREMGGVTAEEEEAFRFFLDEITP
jgi:hypothetical protein